MEVLTHTPRRAAVLKGLAFAGLVAALCAAIAFLGLRQRDIERYGREAVSNDQRVPVASLYDKSGGVVVNRPGALQAKSLEPGDKLFPGDRVQTQSGARATLALNGGARLTLEQNSLLQLPEPKSNSSRNGTVLQIDSGSFHLDSNELKGISSILTPQASIDLKTRDIALVRPQKDLRPDLAYIQALVQIWFPDLQSAPGKKALGILDSATTSCNAKRENECVMGLDQAWSGLVALRREQSGTRVVLDVTIDKTGKENIAVAGGSVSVKTENRTLLIAQGETLNLDGSMPTRQSMSPETLLSLVPKPVEKPPESKPEQEELLFEIESIQWQ